MRRAAKRPLRAARRRRWRLPREGVMVQPNSRQIIAGRLEDRQRFISAAFCAPELSVVIPVYNEEDNVEPLFRRLMPVLRRLDRSFEVIAVNDGSKDQSRAALNTVAAMTPELKIIDFCRNYGQTAAMMAGIDHATGTIIVSLDADLQNDPGDIPALLQRIDEGYDVASGW